MSEAHAAQTRDSEILPWLFRWDKEGYASLTKKQKWNYGWYDIQNLAQDQVIIRISRGSSIDTYRGLHVGTEEDSQSDYTGALRVQKYAKAFDSVIQQFEKMLKRPWGAKYSSIVEELIEYVEVTEEVGEQETDTTTDDVSQWTSDQLASAILHPEAESDMSRLREMILIAEDTGFTVDESKQLAPWLLSFAERHRDSSDPQDEAAIWSAIRTGTSMLTPDDTDGLCPLLEPGHSIETSLVTVKMLGRIFEAQPPAEVDEHQELADEVCQIAESLLNRYAITSSQNAAMAQLAIYALAAMASSEIHRIVKDVQELGVAWFTQQTLHELRELGSIWANRPVPVADQPQKLLDRAIQTLE